MTINKEESPVLINEGNLKLYGVLRKCNKNKNLVLIVPSPTGARIGPHRIFVDLARRLQSNGYPSFCFEIPGNGDSVDPDYKDLDKDLTKELNLRYELYLTKVIDYFKNEYIIRVIISISIGCIPILFSAVNKGIENVVLLSPVDIVTKSVKIDKKNIRLYYYKLFQFQTWKKLFTLNLNIKNIIKNTIPVYSKQKETQIKSQEQVGCKPNVIAIYGENDKDYEQNRSFFIKDSTRQILKSYSEKIVPNADHSFMGWEYKKEVEGFVIEWFKNTFK